jgi:hypothetical protein
MPGEYGRGHSHNPELTDFTRMRVLVAGETRPLRRSPLAPYEYLTRT